MTDIRFTSSIRQALDASAEHLPPSVTHRLAQARLAALDRAGRPSATRPAASHVASGAGLRARLDDRLPGKGWQLAAVALSISLLVAGMVFLGELDARRDASELAELEAAVLSDEVPISTYSDRGFGAYLLKTGLDHADPAEHTGPAGQWTGER